MSEKFTDAMISLCEEYKGKDIRVFFSRYFTQEKERCIAGWGGCAGECGDDCCDTQTPSTFDLGKHPCVAVFLHHTTKGQKQLAGGPTSNRYKMHGTPWSHLHTVSIMYLGAGDKRKKEHGYMLLLKPTSASLQRTEPASVPPPGPLSVAP